MVAKSTKELRLDRAWPLWLALAAAVAFRWPAIAHANETNSDAAVVGLQAMHMLRGEHALFLWGSGYQTSVDSAFAALLFGLFGASARALMASSLLLHLALMALAWNVLARRLDPVRAGLAIVPLVFTSSPLQTYILYPPRQASLTVAVAAVWALDRAAGTRGVRAFAAGGLLLGLACFADPYALVLAPPVLAFGVACAFDEPTRGARAAAMPRLTGLGLGVGLGSIPLALVRASGQATAGQLALSLSTVGHNARLLGDALTWTVGARAWSADGAATYGAWPGPLVARAALFAGGSLFLALVLAGGASVFLKRIPWSVRRLGIVGGLAVPVTLGGYLVSPMVVDLFSARYLAAIPLLAPFAIAPIAWRFGARKLATVLVPCAVACGIAGWAGYGPFLRESMRDEAMLEHALEGNGVHFAIADYWTAYRLTFLTSEGLIAVPMNEAEDRYPPYRQALEAEPIIAYVYDPLRSREDPAWMEQRVEAGQTPYRKQFAIVHAGRFRALVLQR